MHIIETLVDLVQRSVMSDILVNLDFSIKIILGRNKSIPQCPIEFGTFFFTLDKPWNFGPAFDPSESRSSPDTTSDELES